jgi:hypothetical protein
MGNHKESFYSLQERPGFLRLYACNPAGKKDGILWDMANVLTQKLVCPYLEARTCMDFRGLGSGEKAGLVMMGGHYAYLAVKAEEKIKSLVFGRAYDGACGGMKEEIRVLEKLPEAAEQIFFGIILKKGKAGMEFSMYYSLEEKERVFVETDFMPSDHTWVGSKIGLFAIASDPAEKRGYGDFAYIHVKALEGEEG